AGRAGAATAEERARTARRLAGTGTGRRRVALVTCDERGSLAEELHRGPLGRNLMVVGTGTAAGAGPAREGRADDAGAPGGERGREGGARHAREAAGGLARELVALLACCALALLVMVPLGSMIHEGVWEAPVTALLGAGTGLGALAGSLLRRRGTRGWVRALVAAVLAAALVATGAAHALWLFDERVDPASPARETVVWRDGTGAGELLDAEGSPDAATALRTIIQVGSAQLAGTDASGSEQAWDLLVILAGAALAALACALASSRAARAAVALVPLALSAADQVVMGPAAQLDWVGVAVALGLALIWLSVCERPRPARALVVAALSCALGWAGGTLAPAEGSAVWSARGTRVETLVDLSRDLRRRSSAVVLTYQTTSTAPVYLRIGVLDRFDGSTWGFSGDATEGDSPLVRAGIPGNADGWGTLTTPLVATTVWPLEDAGPDAPVPPGTAMLEATDDGGWRATGRYVRPIQAAGQTDSLVNLAYELDGYGGAQSVPDDATLAVPDEVPAEVEEVVARARDEGADASRANSAGQIKAGQLPAVRWLVSYFTDGSFTYSLDAPGGDGQDNLAAIGEFLRTKSGYCTHYATAFALLARELGVPSRVVLGYAPGGGADESGTYTVTMRQLHAWAEVWVDGIGWVGVDVTPAATDAGETNDGDATAPETGDEVTPTDEAPTAEEPAIPDADPDAGETDEDAAGAADGTDPTDGEPGAGTAPWAAAAAGVAAVLAAATGLLAHRRRPAASWQELWERVCRAARRAHLRWGPELTEGEVAELICARLGGDERLAGIVRAIARNACLERYGR
ncbi:transglutaminase family protein, partial [Thermophilibacter sp.]